MLQVILAFIKLILVGLFAIGAAIFAKIAVERWRKKRPFFLLAALAAGMGLVAWGIYSFDLFSAESTDREELVEAFHSNFGFDPPSAVAEIKVKNIAIYDAVGHWMTFTCDPVVLDRVLQHDRPLQVAEAGTGAFDAIVRDAFLKNQNRPDWAVSPEGRTSTILYKKDFLKHSFSEYYLWVDSEAAMVHLHVSYFD